MSGGFNPVNLVSQAALAAVTGGASLAIEAAMASVLSSIVSQVISKVGQELGLPPEVVQIAQFAAQAEMGNVGAAGQSAFQGILQQGTPAQQGAFAAAQDQVSNNLTNMALQGVKQTHESTSSNGAGSTSSASTKGQSLLMKLAIALGQLMDKKMTEMGNLTDQIGKLGAVNNSNQSQLGELTGKLQGLSQEVSMLSNALTNSIKSIGDAATTLARKS